MNAPDPSTAPPPAPTLQIAGYEELPLAELARFPMLTRCYEAWQAAHDTALLPAVIDVKMLPAQVLPYVMLLDYLPEKTEVRVRLAGNYVGERTNAELGGRRLINFFNAHDAAIVFSSMRQVAQTRQASLARRSYVALDGAQFSYVRLILPLSVDGVSVTGFFKTIEPATLVGQVQG